MYEYRNDKKISRATFEATWQDNRKEFSCQAPNNRDQHLVKKFTLTVECKWKKLSQSFLKDFFKKRNETAVLPGPTLVKI